MAKRAISLDWKINVQSSRVCSMCTNFVHGDAQNRRCKNTVTQPEKALYSKTSSEGIGTTMNWPMIETCNYVFLRSTQVVLGTGFREQETLVYLQGHQVLIIMPARTGVSTSHAGIDTLDNSFSSSCKHTLLGAWIIY